MDFSITRILDYPAEILILLFISFTFLQSGYDKIKDWKGNLGWLKSHFSETPFKNSVPVLLAVLLLFEILSGIMTVLGIYTILMYNVTYFAVWSLLLSGITFLFLLIGQRVAKDYAGAMTIAVYFIINILGIISLNN